MQELPTTDIGTLIEPNPVAFSLDAPGWYMLLAVLLLVLVIVGVRRLVIYRKNKYRRVAISMIESFSESKFDPDRFIFKTAETLKRVSMISFGRSALAHLNGISWFAYIEKHDRSAHRFSPLVNKIYTSYLYQKKGSLLSEEERLALRTESINWIKKHRV